MGKFLDNPNEHPYSAHYGPAAYTAASILNTGARCALFGTGVGIVSCTLFALPPIDALRIGAGCGGLLLTACSFADMAGTTIGQVQAAKQMALEAGGAKFDDNDPEPPHGPHIIQVREWALDGEGANGESNVKQARFYDLSLTPRQAGELAAFVESGKGFSEAKVTSACPSIGSKRWDKLKAELLANGLIRFKRDNAPTLGVETTNKFRALARVILHSPIK